MSHYRILVTGSEGQLGSEINLLANSIISDGIFFFTDYKELDVTDKRALENFVANKKINVIINCAAYTAVDKAETEKKKAELVNAIAPKYLAEIANDFKCKLVHISTDYVYDGTNYKPYVETDAPNPLSVYGYTKLQGENYIREINPNNTIIIRTSWVYSRFGNNFVKTMVKLGKERQSLNIISDQIGSPTSAKDLAELILKVIPKIKNKDVDVFHFSNEGVCSWYDFAKSIFEIYGLKIEINPITTINYPTPAKRPYLSVLNKQKIKETFGIKIKYWKTSLLSVLESLKNDF